MEIKDKWVKLKKNSGFTEPVSHNSILKVQLLVISDILQTWVYGQFTSDQREKSE
jgi:hypothetical protein